MSSLDATLSQAGASGTLALVSHVGCEEQETEVRDFYTVRLLGLSDSLRARLSSVQALYLFSFSSRYSSTWHTIDTSTSLIEDLND